MLNLANDQLSGPIPPEIGNARRLEALHLDRNQLSGPIPSEIGNLKYYLKRLDLHGNRFSGAIPPEIGNLTALNGTNFIDCLGMFEADPQTEKVVMIGEIGGTDEISILGKNINVMLNSLQNIWAMKDSAEFSLQQKIEELERFKTITIDREIKMIELKKQLKELQSRLERKM